MVKWVKDRKYFFTYRKYDNILDFLHINLFSNVVERYSKYYTNMAELRREKRRLRKGGYWVSWCNIPGDWR